MHKFSSSLGFNDFPETETETVRASETADWKFAAHSIYIVLLIEIKLIATPATKIFQSFDPATILWRFDWIIITNNSNKFSSI